MIGRGAGATVGRAGKSFEPSRLFTTVTAPLRTISEAVREPPVFARYVSARSVDGPAVLLLAEAYRATGAVLPHVGASQSSSTGRAACLPVLRHLHSLLLILIRLLVNDRHDDLARQLLELALRELDNVVDKVFGVDVLLEIVGQHHLQPNQLHRLIVEFSPESIEYRLDPSDTIARLISGSTFDARSTYRFTAGSSFGGCIAGLSPNVGHCGSPVDDDDVPLAWLCCWRRLP
ncbi:hypothetical protein SYNPS1DRAFT_29589 [Syncephalis pseudoplumigaleata]|uniref:Uncharacterized protein n=1 Tax=Syncephalis pseudoplumigaleata TaxID=1712513 RepID=A0A4P9YZ34_9FUNG|nr:hypothetical protein SYNPS1DRAFT_29589 [Syncephalis pseudoplumigaleata]|eukprot:RKP24651.1 hypothetical protein SYNPS1DRAFT_29589 [Syncephalis pseudoplumigaleata]